MVDWCLSLACSISLDSPQAYKRILSSVVRHLNNFLAVAAPCNRSTLLAMASPRSPPLWLPSQQKFQLFVEFGEEEYRLTWTEESSLPDLSQMASLDPNRWTVALCHSSPEQKSNLHGSTFQRFGADAQVRQLLVTREMSMIKMAHNDIVCRRRIALEFAILQDLDNRGVPVVKTDPLALRDASGMFGFRMEKLQHIRPTDYAQYESLIENAVQTLHDAGFVHGDLTISNVMLNREDDIRLIDFGLAGPLGQPLPDDHPARYRGMSNFSRDLDLLALKEMKKRCLGS